MRLMDMRIEPFLLNAAITGVLAQRLVKKLCQECKEQRPPTEQEFEVLQKFHVAPGFLYESKGCRSCFYIGHKGRTGIFQLLPMSSGVRALIVKQPSFDDICEQAVAEGMQPLWHDGITKVLAGEIALDELARVIF